MGLVTSANDMTALVLSSAAGGGVITAASSGWQSRRTAQVVWRRDQLAAKYVALNQAVDDLWGLLTTEVTAALQTHPMPSLDEEFAAYWGHFKTLRAASDQVFVVGAAATFGAAHRLLAHLDEPGRFFPYTGGGGVAALSSQTREDALEVLALLREDLIFSMRQDLGLMSYRWHPRRRGRARRLLREQTRHVQDRVADHRATAPEALSGSALVEGLRRYGCRSTSRGFVVDAQEFQDAAASILPGRDLAALVVTPPGTDPQVMIAADLTPAEQLEALRRVGRLVHNNFRSGMAWKALQTGRAHFLLRAETHVVAGRS